MAQDRPNILLILSDEHNPQMAGCYGHEIVRTPRLDALAAEGVTFEQAYCNSPTCVCSRASLMTGRYVHEIGVFHHGNPLRSDIPTFAHYFEAAGYETVLCGKMHFVGEWNQLHGFGRRLLGEPEQWTGGWDKSKVRTEATRRGSNSHVTSSGPGRPFFPVGYDELVTDLSCRFLAEKAERPAGRPWLLVAGLLAPHFPLYAPQEYFDLYYPGNVVMPAVGYEPGRDEHPVIRQIRRWLRQEDGIPESITRRSLAAYYGLVTFTDHNIGRMLDIIDQSSLRENTVVIYTSDHGEMAGHHGLWQKFCFYEPSVRVPLVVRYPGGPRGIRVKESVSLVDLAPTLCDFAGIEPPRGFSGASLLPLVREEAARGGGTEGPAGGVGDGAGCGAPGPAPGSGCGPSRTVFAEYHAHGILGSAYMIRKGRYKYNYYPGYPPQLFDLEADPDEVRDLSADPAFRGVVEALHAELLSLVDPDVLAAKVKEWEKLPGIDAVKRFPFGELAEFGKRG